jgi:hypothetical protein
MGCRCANSHEEEYEINKREATKENIFKNKEGNELNNSKNHFSNNDFNSDKNNNTNFSPNLNDGKYFHGNEESQNIDMDQEKQEILRNQKYLNYPERIIEIINNIRQDPVSYADVVLDSMKNIVEDNNKNDATKNKIIYKRKVKVALTRGKPAFLEAAEDLRNTKPLPPLEFVPEICIPLPEDEFDMKDNNFLKKKVIELKKEGINIDIFYKDLVKIPEVSALLMIVDDSGKNSGKKRMTLLDKDIKYIGVNSTFIGKTFIAYLSFAKSNDNYEVIN